MAGIRLELGGHLNRNKNCLPLRGVFHAGSKMERGIVEFSGHRNGAPCSCSLRHTPTLFFYTQNFVLQLDILKPANLVNRDVDIFREPVSSKATFILYFTVSPCILIH